MGVYGKDLLFHMSTTDLLRDIHHGLQSPEDQDAVVVKGSYSYYHYLCDGLDDRGWGCGYRTLQTMCSWIQEQELQYNRKPRPVPSLQEIQQALVTIEDKPKRFLGSRDWIGSVEVGLCIDYFYDVPCKIIHIQSGSELTKHVATLREHFTTVGCPVMMGGDSDNASKGILGVCQKDRNDYLLILDPHFSGKTQDRKLLQNENWMTWRSLDSFMENSFYNLCIPQYKHGVRR